MICVSCLEFFKFPHHLIKAVIKGVVFIVALIYEKIEIENCVQFLAIIGSEHFIHFNACAAAFAHSVNIIITECFFAHFVQIFMQTRAVKIILGALITRQNSEESIGIRQAGSFADKVDNIHPEAVYSLIKPPAHHFINTVSHIFVFPIQIHLLFGEKVHCPLI